jgi:O-antigen/teichoic acid export membrane protein
LSTKINVAANFIGRVWGTAVSILFLPLYIKFLGIESYGLVGFYSTLLGSMTILDLGLSATLNRELAKFKAENRSPEDIRNLTFSLECIYWGIGLMGCLLIFFASNFISSHWLNLENLPAANVREAVILMGIVVAFQWPISLYDGGLRGLDGHVVNNTIIVITATVRAVGVILVLKYLSPTVTAFFIWQALLSCLYVVLMRFALWKKMPVFAERPKFSKSQLKLIWRFAAGMTGVGLITFFLAQIDKIVLSKILPLSQFGYYNLAFTIASSISLIVAPISLTFFPRFARLVAGKQEIELKKIYHQTCKFIAVIIFPVCFTLISFMKEILLIWTKSNDTANNTYLLAQILLIGSMFNSLMIIPYNLIIATGWTKFTFYQNTIAAIILVPLLFIWTNAYGALGASFVWLSVNVGYVLFSQPLMHRKLLKGELKKWYLNDTLFPMLPSFLLLVIIRMAINFFIPGIDVNLFMIGFILIIALGISMVFDADARVFLKNILKF